MEPLTFLALQGLLIVVAGFVMLLGFNFSILPAKDGADLKRNSAVGTVLIIASAVIILVVMISVIFHFFEPMLQGYIVVEDEILGLPLLLAVRSKKVPKLLWALPLLLLFSCTSTPKLEWEKNYTQCWKCETSRCIDTLRSRADISIDSVQLTAHQGGYWRVWTSQVFQKDPYPDWEMYAFPIPSPLGGVIMYETKWPITSRPSLQAASYEELIGKLLAENFILRVTIYGQDGQWVTSRSPVEE